MDMQNYTTPFANTGDTEEFSIDTDPSGKVSLEKGWTELYQLRPEEGGLFILRKVFNQMMKLVSTDTVTWKTQAFPNWIDDKGDGLPYAYPKNAIVKATDGENYVSLIDDNEDNPIGSVNWINLAEYGREKELSITGTVSFNSTTNNIELTNIVTALGLEIGDVIQISGADDTKNNSEFTVEVITDNNNIIVNQAHANKGTSKNIANRSGDTDVTIKLLSKWYNASDSLGRDWVNVTSSRNLSTTYSNTTRPFEVQIVIGGGQTAYSLYSNGTRIYYIDGEPGIIPTITGKVTKGNYNASISVGSGTLTDWLELR